MQIIKFIILSQVLIYS